MMDVPSGAPGSVAGNTMAPDRVPVSGAIMSPGDTA
jgi:hypothetical protein